MSLNNNWWMFEVHYLSKIKDRPKLSITYFFYYSNLFALWKIRKHFLPSLDKEASDLFLLVVKILMWMHKICLATSTKRCICSFPIPNSSLVQLVPAEQLLYRFCLLCTFSRFFSVNHNDLQTVVLATHLYRKVYFIQHSASPIGKYFSTMNIYITGIFLQIFVNSDNVIIYQC